MLGGLELNVDIDDLVSEDKVLVVALDPRRLGAVLHLADSDKLQHESRVDLCRVLAVDFFCEGHQIAQPCSLHKHNKYQYKVRKLNVDRVRTFSQHAPKHMKLHHLFVRFSLFFHLHGLEE